MTILEAIQDPNLFGKEFSRPEWRAWRVLLRALFGLPMSGKDLDVYRRHTALESPPSGPVHEAWLCVGRRGGKSRIGRIRLSRVLNTDHTEGCVRTVPRRLTRTQ